MGGNGSSRATTRTATAAALRPPRVTASTPTWGGATHGSPARLTVTPPAAAAVKPGAPGALLRTAAPEHETLLATLFTRYPDAEWATFARFGWRETPDGLVLTLAALDPPMDGDLDDAVGHVAIQEPYTVRIARLAERHALAVGVVHSHPQDSRTVPSWIDDDMDSYYADYFADFARAGRT